ncbi:MAG: serine/threonine protein kinase [Acidobacteria bacterium]|nr:serine/threonine protein kinase [Acidobacteriota bacterium]
MPRHDAPTSGNETRSSSDEPTRASEAPPGALSSLTGTAPSLPAMIGPYRILRLLGEGGMGVVYEAEQASPRRTVALKVIKAGHANGEMLRRFENEALALGRLQHPGIGQIYDAGTADTPFGRQPYFAMELVHGQPLVDYCETHQLTAQQRLELIATICDAVQHAHQRALIHRDLKPANILVDESGQPHILDFGVARLTDSDAQATRQTDMGQLIGTLAYMSPEQVLGDPAEIDTRSDVYALGVILYEVLAGKRPYELGRQLTEVVRTISEQEPTALRSVNRTYRGDIDTIVNKALEKDKTRRYASAAELAADIHRHLRDEPIMARPPSASYLLQKFARRNRALVFGAAAVLVVLVLGVVTSTWLAVQARRAETKARQQSAIAEAVNEFLQNDLLAQASANNQAGPRAKPDPDLKVRTALDRAAVAIEGKFNDQPEVEAAIRKTIGQTYAQLAQYAESRRQLDRAFDLERRVWGPESPKTLNTLNALARTVWHQGRYSELETLIAPALEIERRVLGPEHPDTLFAMNILGNVNRALGREAPAEALYRQTLEIRRRVLAPEHPDTLISMNNLANVFWSQGKYGEAQVLYGQTLEIQRRVLGPEHPDTLLSMGNLADAFGKDGKYAEAGPLFTETVAISHRVLGADHPRTLAFLMDFASMYQRQGKYAMAETLSAQVLAGRLRAIGSEHPDSMPSAPDLALAYVSQRKFAQSEPLARAAMVAATKAEPDGWQRFRAESLLGASLAGKKKYLEAEPRLLEGYQGMLARKDSIDAPDRYHLHLAHQWLVDFYQAWGKPAKAAEWRRSMPGT